LFPDIVHSRAGALLIGNSALFNNRRRQLAALATRHGLPTKYTCEGEDVSPPLAWEAVPNGAKSLVLIIDDPDAPDPKAPKMVWVYWVVYNIPAETNALPENADKAGCCSS
jgi:Raf kinase inhibitor-like YbhB/YbcL family protein